MEPMNTATETEPKDPPPATYQEVLGYLRNNNYTFPEEVIKSKIISLPKDRGEGNKSRKIGKAITKELEKNKEWTADYDRLAEAFSGMVLKRTVKPGTTVGRAAKTREEYIKDLKTKGVKSSSAGVLTLNVAKIFSFGTEKIENKKGESVDSFTKADFIVEVDPDGKGLRIKMMKKK